MADFSASGSQKVLTPQTTTGGPPKHVTTPAVLFAQKYVAPTVLISVRGAHPLDHATVVTRGDSA